MAMEMDADKINDADRQVEQRLWKEAEKYAADNAESKKRNKNRQQSRDNIKEMGFSTLAYQWAVRLAKDFSPAEAKAILGDVDFLYKLFVQRQQDLFPEEFAKIHKREQAARLKAEAEAARTGDDNPRSDPNKGGAKPRTGKKAKTLKEASAASDAAIAESLANVQAGEQAEGAAVLNSVGTQPVDNVVDIGAPKSQSAKAAEIAEQVHGKAG